jgi:putative cell wall-binding protein
MLDQQKTRNYKQTLLVLVLSVFVIVAGVLWYKFPNQSVSTFLGLAPKTTSSTKDAYKPIESSEFLELDIKATFKNDEKPSIQIEKTSKGTLASGQNIARSAGNYYLELYNSKGEWLDAVFFNLSENVRILNNENGQEKTQEQPLDAVSTAVQIPYNNNISKVVVKSVEDQASSQEISLKSKDLNITSLGTTSVSDCADPLYQGDGQGHFIIKKCTNFDKYPAIAGEFKDLYLELKENFPELVYSPINEVFLGNTEEMSIFCDSPGTYYGCAYGDGSIGLNVFTPFFFKNVGAHELGHGLLFASASIADLPTSSPSYPALAHVLDEFSQFINDKYSVSRNCEFTYDIHSSEAPKFRKNSNNLFSDWYHQNATISPTGLLDCNQFFCPWDAAHNTHPVLKTYEPYSERPGNPGSVTNYGAFNYNEKFAELYASMYKGLSGIGIPRSLKDIFQIFDPNQSKCQEAGVDCNTEKLRKDVQILGNFCLVEDADHDGVTDDADTCSPKRDCPGNADACYNPSQKTERGCGLVTERVRGEVDRYDTAIAVSTKTFPASDSASAVVVASGENYPDALSASLFAFQKNAPILLAQKDFISSKMLREIERVLPTRGKVYVMGGPAALSDKVLQTIRSFNNAGFDVERVAGKNDRIDTALEVAKRVSGNPDTFFVTNSKDFVDPLTASAVSAQKKIPLLLTPASDFDKRVVDFLSQRAVSKIYIVGGYASVSKPMEDELVAKFRNVERINDTSYPFSNSIALTNKFFPQSTLNTFTFATGEKYPDALASSVLAAKNGSPLILVPSRQLPASISDYMASKASSTSKSYILGGEAAVDLNSELDINDAMKR